MAKKKPRRNRKPPAAPKGGVPVPDQPGPPPSLAAPQPPRIFAAVTNPQGQGLVERGSPLDADGAVQFLRARGSVVVCGGEMRANRHLARTLMETAHGGALHENPHDEGGRDCALPHFHPPGHVPTGVHAFYETAGRWARGG